MSKRFKLNLQGFSKASRAKLIVESRPFVAMVLLGPTMRTHFHVTSTITVMLYLIATGWHYCALKMIYCTLC